MSPGSGIGDSENISRRAAVRTLAAGTLIANTASTLFANPGESSSSDGAAERTRLSRRQRIRGMLLGSLFGDALGGPLEFVDDARRVGHVLGAREWSDTQRLFERRDLLPTDPPELLSYRTLRPQTEPYGVWHPSAPAGTVTDDSRLKIILMRSMITNGVPTPPTRQSIARSILDFRPHEKQPLSPEVRELCDAGMREYRLAARWELGDRDSTRARPLKRLWSGVDNCSGQMMLLPIAASLAGTPDQIYRQAYELNVVDTAAATDIASAIITGLSAVLNIDETSNEDARGLWRRLETTMRNTDPFGYADVPFVGRPLIAWMDLADRIVEASDGVPKVAYRMLETDGQPRYFWDAHFTFLVPWTLLKLARFDASLAWRLTLDFGHDTDSYLQLLGAWLGSIHGPASVGDASERIMRDRLHQDYGEDLDVWVDRLDGLYRQTSHPR